MKSLSLNSLLVYTDSAAIYEAVTYIRNSQKSIAFIPTMGALHEGHLELIRQARTIYSQVIVSIFVNPLQFNPDEDFDHYPRTVEADIELLCAEDVDIVFIPPVSELYTPDSYITVNPGPLGTQLEGASRPGFFMGVLTVVNKLFNILRPNAAYFGEKDYQQLVLIQKMVQDLHYDITIVSVPTVRESDGLAMSSRNCYLTAQQREAATVIPQALYAAQAISHYGPEAIYNVVHTTIAQKPLVNIDYIELRSVTLDSVPQRGEARLLIAAHIGSTRLIDNISVHL